MIQLTADYGDDPPVVERSFGVETPASVAVIEALCAIEDVDPVDAPPKFNLYEHIDPSALDRMVADGTGDGDVIVDLAVEEYRVLVSNTGRIRVRPRG